MPPDFRSLTPDCNLNSSPKQKIAAATDSAKFYKRSVNRCGRGEPLAFSERQSLAQMSKFTNHRAISLFFCRGYFPPVYWKRHKTQAEPKVGRSQNGTASNRKNLPQSSLTLASAVLDRIKGHFPSKLPTRDKAVRLIRQH
jgi:hypothetical protein